MTSSVTGHLAHQFDDLRQQRQAATLGMWAFLATEVLFFGGMFAGYAVYRHLYLAGWDAGSRRLDLTLGTINTAVLLTSSLTMALAVHSAAHGESRNIRRWLVATACLGIVFLGIKGVEYHHKWVEHLVPGPYFEWNSKEGHGSPPMNADTGAGPAIPPASAPPGVELFFSFYFVMTGWHALHMLIGLGLLTSLWIRAGRHEFSSEYYTPVELTGLYWHFVDIVWVFLFPLLYLVDRS